MTSGQAKTDKKRLLGVMMLNQSLQTTSGRAKMDYKRLLGAMMINAASTVLDEEDKSGSVVGEPAAAEAAPGALKRRRLTFKQKDSAGPEQPPPKRRRLTVKQPRPAAFELPAEEPLTASVPRRARTGPYPHELCRGALGTALRVLHRRAWESSPCAPRPR